MDALIACLGFIGTLVVLSGFLALLRCINYKETLALAEKGLGRPKSKPGRGLLRWGGVLSALGLALSIVLYLIGFNSPNDYPLHLGPWMLGGFVPLFLGIFLILVHVLTEKG